MKIGIPKLVAAISDQLFMDDREEILTSFFTYNEVEFAGEQKPEIELVATSKHSESEKENK
jgi:hypothetical protein